MKQQLLQLIEQKKISLIKDYLENLPKRDKGPIFEWYLAELYQGNGWLTKIQGGRGDSGADILLYHPKTPHQVSLIVQAKNHAMPLTFDQTKIELIKFEQQAASQYQCQQFNLVAVNGFVQEAQKLSEFNLLLSDWSYITHLIEHFDPENRVEPEIQLFAHNQNAYQQVKVLWQQNRSVAVVQATGTGKSLIIAKVMADFWPENQLLMAPSHYILEQQQTKVPWAAQSTQFMTYAKGANLTIDEINQLQLKLIILDEFHRCGAEVWGAGVQRILDAHPNAYVFGTTATPIRYLDSSRDMSDELFDGVVAVDLSLADAIVKRILPAPTYIAALYTLAEEINDLLEILKNSNKSDEEKQAIAVEINQAKLDWERTSGIPEILKKHLTPNINKFIVFCKDQEHLDKMEIEVQRWFQQAKIHRWRKIYRVLSTDPDSNQNLAAFKQAQSKNTAHLLFAIDMLNEGLHIADVGAVILLRPTESPIIFYQQIGRCLQVDIEHTPIIFDFVNNFKSIRASDFLESLQDAREREQEKRAELGLEECAPVVRIVDETQEIIEVFESVKERLQPWEVMFQQLVEFKEVHGHCNVPNKYTENYALGKWVQHQREAYKKDKLNKKRIIRLKEIGFIWSLSESKKPQSWGDRFQQLVEFKEVHGHCNVPQKDPKSRQLGSWVSNQRRHKKAGVLDQDKIIKLNKVGFVWDSFEISWEKMFETLTTYKNVHRHCHVPKRYPENPSLASWVQNQRHANKNGTISEEHIRKLNEIGFIWNPYEVYWEKMYAMLVDFVNEYGHCKVPFNWHENSQLSRWFFAQRNLKRKGELSQQRIEKLEKLGFDWDPLDTDWNEMYKKLIEYKDIYGNCNVPARWSKGLKLGRWVNVQRQTRKRGKLNEERIEKLNNIGFIWNPSQAFENIWEEMFETLIEYKNVHGHCNVPQKWRENPILGHWVSRQRAAKKEGQLEQKRIEKLNSIGFVWDVKNASWEEMFAQLVEYKTVHGHCNVPNKYPQNPELGRWVAVQRTSKKNGTLSGEYIERLDKIGFVWKALETSWEEMFSALVEYKNKYGHCNVPQNYSESPKLAIWVSHQRVAKQKGTIIDERKKRLEEIGFVWNTLEASWEKMFTELIEYKNIHGHCHVPHKYSENPQLGNWVNNQRQNKKQGILSKERIAKLNEIGFMWNPSDEFWETMFKSLVEYKEIYGNCNVPAQWNENKQLGNWVSHQRTAKKRDELPQKYIERLNTLGFVWEPSKTYWEEMFEALLEYKNIYGHCRVPNKCSEIPRLNSWVVTQRKLKKEDKLEPEYVDRLNKIGFVWNPYEEFWEQMFTMLTEYKDKYGHCKVPNQYSENPQLGRWVQHQRQAKKKGELSKERIERLNDLGFLWSLLDEQWEKKFTKLVEYKKIHGNCHVPKRFTENPTLGTWVQNQRIKKQKGKLSQEHIQRLEAIGFTWNPK